MNMNPVATLGADPEVFVRPLNSPRSMVPVFDKVGGEKSNPLPMAGMDEGFFYLEDGAALEFNIPPYKTAWEFSKGLIQAQEWLNGSLLRGKGLKITDGNVIKLSDKQLLHPKAKVIGCSKDFHAWGVGLVDFARQSIDVSALGRERYAGCHLHLGLNTAEVPAHVAAQFMDLFVGLKCVALDKQDGRRSVYGLPGLYRPKPYGIEYRTLSSLVLADHYRFWDLQGEDTLLGRCGAAALQFGNMTYNDIAKLQRIYGAAPWNDVQQAIATEDSQLANAIEGWLRAFTG